MYVRKNEKLARRCESIVPPFIKAVELMVEVVLLVLAEGGGSELFAGDITTHGRYGELSKTILQ